MPNRKRKQKSKNQKTKIKTTKKSSKASSEFFHIFLDLNKAFMRSSRTGQFNFKSYFNPNSYAKVKVIPSKFLHFWEGSQRDSTITPEQVASKFVEYMNELRPNQVPDFEPLIFIDNQRFPIDSKCFYLG